MTDRMGTFRIDIELENPRPPPHDDADGGYLASAPITTTGSGRTP
jgi:hypothetical protein